MTKFSAIERLRNSIRSYRAGLEMADAGVVVFASNVDDVKALLQAYKELRAASEDLVAASKNPMRMAMTPHLIRLLSQTKEDCDRKIGEIK